MSSEIIFFIIVVFLCLDFVLERVLESLNSKHMSPVLPDSLKGIYEEKEYSRFQSYKRENGRLDSWSSGVFVLNTLYQNPNFKKEQFFRQLPDGKQSRSHPRLPDSRNSESAGQPSCLGFCRHGRDRRTSRFVPPGFRNARQPAGW